MLGMNTLRAQEPVETAPDQWPAEIGEQMAAAHRIYPVVDETARLVELLRRWRSCTPRVKGYIAFVARHRATARASR